MATERQIEANRRNAQKSTGPRTPQGKARSRLNAVKHGLTSRLPVLPDEDGEQFEEFRMEVSCDLRPEGTVETALVVRIAAVQWRLARVPGIEAELLEAAGAGGAGGTLAQAFRVAGEELERLRRYESALERSLSRLLKELRALQSARRSLAAEEGAAAKAARSARRYAAPPPAARRRSGVSADEPDRLWGDLPVGSDAPGGLPVLPAPDVRGALPPMPRRSVPAEARE